MSPTKPFFSIIIPVYRTEEFLRQCLESVKNGGFENFECLVVLDGDSSLAIDIFDKVAGSDKRFKLFTKSHGGVSDTRNFGINQATGDFILFVDSDDYLYPEGMKLLHEQLNLYSGFGDKQLFFGSILIPAFEFSQHKNFATSLIYLQNSIMEGPIKRKLLGELRFNTNLNYGEDCELLYRVFLKSRSNNINLKFVTFDQDIIYYRQRQGSLNHGLDTNQKMQKSILVYKEILKQSKLSFREKIICHLAIIRCKLSIDLNLNKRIFRALVVRVLKLLAGW